MSKRRDIERRLRSLGEIGEIMSAMKNLAFMETHKLTRLIATQRRAAASIRSTVDDFLLFHPELLVVDETARDVHLLIGSERGFCGDFNDSLLQSWRSHPRSKDPPALIAIGSKLAARLAHDSHTVARLEGPNALEQVEAVLLKAVEALEAWRAEQSPPCALRVTAFHHEADGQTVAVTRLDPFGRGARATQRSGYAPLLNLEPRLFFAKLAEHYLYAALHGIFYTSLMGESQRRMQHMDYAVHRIEDDSRSLALKRNSLRQEEITEEIEVIMLNIDTAHEGWSSRPGT